MTKLGNLKSIDLRTVWNHEAYDFTRWLARDENISILLEELDIEIKNIKLEESAGRYSVDIIADEIDSGKRVIIENQLETTDHKHLGQILTYASAHDASIIIWIVKDYTEEHKQAIDWFNRHMPEQISFFLVQLELWQIGNSEPAPRFNIISQPNNWAKTVRAASVQERGNPSELKLTQKRFWDTFKEYVNKSGNEYNINLGRTPRPQHWYELSIGTSKARVSLTINSKLNQIGCGLYIPNDEDSYRKIEADKSFIQSQLGADVEFMDLPERNAFRIVKYYSADPLDESRWPEYFAWCNEQAGRFQKTFKKYFK
ncbi:MAG: DUF4268 domain-containing protein [Cyclobacteriaceae bacterium]